MSSLLSKFINSGYDKKQSAKDNKAINESKETSTKEAVKSDTSTQITK